MQIVNVEKKALSQIDMNIRVVLCIVSTPTFISPLNNMER